MSAAVLVLAPEDVAVGQLILQVYGDPSQRIDDGLISEGGEHPELPLSLVESVTHQLDTDVYLAQLACGSQIAMPAEARVEVVSR